MKLEDFLRHANVSVLDFAKEIGISGTYLYQIIREKRRPNKEMRDKIDALTGGLVDHPPFFSETLSYEMSVAERLSRYVAEVNYIKEAKRALALYMMSCTCCFVDTKEIKK